jgi:hypothetical protein
VDNDKSPARRKNSNGLYGLILSKQPNLEGMKKPSLIAATDMDVFEKTLM